MAMVGLLTIAGSQHRMGWIVNLRLVRHESICLLIIGLIPAITVAVGRMAPQPVEDCITIEAPATACGGREFKLFAKVVDGSSAAELTYSWTVSAGIIVRGKSSSQLFVRGYAGKNIQAKVKVGGLKSECATTSKTIKVKIVSCPSGN